MSSEWFRARALSTILGVLVLLGAASGPVALWLTLNRDQPPAESRLDYPDSRAGTAGEFASLFVASWLRGDDLGFFNQNLTADDSGLLVERVGAVQTIERGRGLFDVVVAADLVEFISGSEEQFRPIGLRFYSVGVALDDDDDLVVLGLPSVVTRPATAQAPAHVITELRRPDAPEVVDLAGTLSGFFAAYLAGDGEVDLFASPGSEIGAVTPTPFGQSTVQQLGWSPVPGVDDPAIRLVRVMVDAISPSGSQELEYSLVVAERDGRWEVSQVLNAPTVFTDGTSE